MNLLHTTRTASICFPNPRTRELETLEEKATLIPTRAL